MRTTALLFLAIFGAACAKTESRVSPPAHSEPVADHAAPAANAKPAQGAGLASAEAPLGGSPDYVPPARSFHIVKVYEKQKPTEHAPWHEAGGDWIFFDARIADHGPSLFTFGMKDVAPKGAMPIAFADGILAVPDRASGAALVSALASAFHQKEPTPAAARPLVPLKMRLVILGRGMSRSPGGGFSNGGSWTTTKLFLQSDALEAEVFFNFDPRSGQGEFSQKDADYDHDVVAVVAALRDGLSPKTQHPR